MKNLIYFIFISVFLSMNPCMSQDIYRKNLHSINIGAGYAIESNSFSNPQMYTSKLGYLFLKPINRALAFEAGINYKLSYLMEISHDFNLNIGDNTNSGFIVDDKNHFYHFVDVPVFLSIKLGRKHYDRLFFGANVSIPIIQALIKSEYYVLQMRSDLFTTNFSGIFGYRFQLEKNYNSKTLSKY